MSQTSSWKANHQIDEETLNIWKEKQNDIASKVIILQDDETTNKMQPLESRYKSYPSIPSHREELYGGVDISFPGTKVKHNLSVAVYVIMKGQEMIYHSYEFFQISIPYVSSFLAFREIDPLEKLVKKQMLDRPDLTPKAILVDGNGIMHIRRAGIACFLGVRTGIPTIGVSKKFYCFDDLTIPIIDMGIYDRVRTIQAKITSNPFPNQSFLLVDTNAIHGSSQEENENKSKFSLLDIIQNMKNDCNGIAMYLKGKHDIIGAALIGHGGNINEKKRHKCGTTKPIYISIGHSISLLQSIQICTELSFARIPEPIRNADLLGRELIRNYPC